MSHLNKHMKYALKKDGCQTRKGCMELKANRKKTIHDKTLRENYTEQKRKGRPFKVA